jgi:ADP-ribose pyrophosphatase YjhB (NUDIX family)
VDWLSRINLQWAWIQSAFRLILRHPVCGVVMVPVLADGDIVLVRRRDNGCWSLPGGMVEWGEDIPTTIVRELFEETGLTVTQIGRIVGVYSAPKRDSRFHSICTTVEVMVEGQFCIGDTLEISEVQSFAPTQIPMDELSHDHCQQLTHYWQGTAVLA